MTDYHDPLRNPHYPYHSGISVSDLREAGPAWAVLIGAIVLVGLLVYAFGGRDLPMSKTNPMTSPSMTNTAPPPAMPAPRTPAAPIAPPQ
jgi:hypothetical protein